jgi:hypothetical protein
MTTSTITADSVVAAGRGTRVIGVDGRWQIVHEHPSRLPKA